MWIYYAAQQQIYTSWVQAKRTTQRTVNEHKKRRQKCQRFEKLKELQAETQANSFAVH